MSESPEEVREHIALYWKIGIALLVLTVVTVGVSYIDFGDAVALTVFVALVIAMTKGSLVASFFMHLIGEKRAILATLLLTVLFFLVLIFIPILGHTDTYGVHKTMPNADAPAAGDHH